MAAITQFIKKQPQPSMAGAVQKGRFDWLNLA
jgi:hypothetical protein